MNFGDTGQEGHCSKWLFTRHGASHLVFSFYVPQPMPSVLGIGKNKEGKCFEPSKSSINHWGRKEKIKEGKKERRERWREGENENQGVQIFSDDQSLRRVSRGLHLATTQLSINRPVSGHMFFSLILTAILWYMNHYLTHDAILNNLTFSGYSVNE